jgi:2-isopropylmalate synthase
MDLVTFALNLLTQGIEPGIDLSHLHDIRKVCEEITGLPVHPRTPYSGEYYLKAFSGAHQDAISKGLQRRSMASKVGVATAVWPTWRVPYLPLDPADIGCSLDDVVCFNSQSGKGGVAWIVHSGLGLDLPTELARIFSSTIKERSALLGRGMAAEEVCVAFLDAYQVREAASKSADESVKMVLHKEVSVEAALGQLVGLPNLSAWTTSQSITGGPDSGNFASYALVTLGEGEMEVWGVGIGVNQQQAELRAILSAICVSKWC